MKNKCEHCKSKKDLQKNGKSYNGLNIRWLCRKCNTARIRKYRSTEEGRRKSYEASLRSIKKFPERQRARVKVNQALYAGKIIKPKKCTRCKKGRKLEGHHSDYTKPLKVKWVCRPCHSILDKRRK